MNNERAFTLLNSLQRFSLNLIRPVRVDGESEDQGAVAATKAVDGFIDEHCSWERRFGLPLRDLPRIPTDYEVRKKLLE